MKITDIISITELSRLLDKSRPTVYKYISDFERGKDSALPHSVRKLFIKIQSGEFSKREIYEYCHHWFGGEETPMTFRSAAKQETKTTLQDIVQLLKKYEKKLDFTKLKEYIEQEIEK